MDKILNILKNDKKRQMILLLIKNEMDVGEIVKALSLSQPQTSMMLKELRDQKIVEYKVDGKKRIYKINNFQLEGMIREIKNFLSEMLPQFENEIIVRK